MSIQLAPDDSIELRQNCYSAVRYVGTYDRTYYAYVTSDKVYVNYYDHDTHDIGTPSLLYTYASVDIHGAPSLCIPTSGTHAGKVIVFYALHTSVLYCRRATTAESISAWVSGVTVESSLVATYPNPRIMSNGDIWLFYRRYNSSTTGSDEVYRVSSDGGSTWGDYITVASAGPDVVYATVSNIIDDEVHVCWYTYDYSEARSRDVRHIYTTNKTDWYDTAGTGITLPATESVPTIITSHENASDYQSDALLVSSGDLRVLIHHRHLPGFVPIETYYCIKESGVWSLKTIDTPAGSEGGQIDPEYPFMFVIPEDDPDYSVYDSRLVVISSDDSGTTWNKAGLTDYSGGSWGIHNPCYVRNGSGSMRIFATHMIDYTSSTDWNTAGIYGYATLVAVADTDHVDLSWMDGTRTLIERLVV